MKWNHTPAPWIYEESTKTIRSVPANYWLASMNSFDGAVDNAANARLIAIAPQLLNALMTTKALLPSDVQEGIDELLMKLDDPGKWKVGEKHPWRGPVI